jgi:hypothetical protein
MHSMCRNHPELVLTAESRKRVIAVFELLIAIDRKMKADAAKNTKKRTAKPKLDKQSSLKTRALLLLNNTLSPLYSDRAVHSYDRHRSYSFNQRSIPFA